VTYPFESTPHSDYRQEQVNGLVGREPWRQARLTDATGPTGPTGVVQNMAAPTGPYEALVESNLCWSGSPGVILRTAAWGFSQTGGSGSRQFAYNDGTFRIYALANADLSRGVWVEVDAPPETTYPLDALYGPPLNSLLRSPRTEWPVTITIPQIQATPTFVETGDYVEAERPLFLQTGWYARGQEFSQFYEAAGFTGGAIRVVIGQGSETIQEFYGLTPMAGHEAVLSRTQALAAIQAFEPVEQMLSQSQQVRVGVQVGFSGNVSQGFFNGYETTIPIVVTAENLLGEPLQNNDQSPPEVFFRQGVQFTFDASRVVNAYHNTPPPNFTSTPLGCSVHQATLHGNNRTNSYMPTGATGPHLMRLAYYGGHRGDRPDLHQPIDDNTTELRPSAHHVDTYAVDGPQWHEDAIIHDTYALAQNGARHKFTLTFAQAPQSTGPADDQANIGFVSAPFFGGDLSFVFNPNFFWFVGNQSIEFFPTCAGRNLLPRMYYSGFKSFPATTISSLRLNTGQLTAYPCDVDIQPMCHAFAFTRKLTAGGALPGSKVVPTSQCGTDFPSSLGVSPIVYRRLPLPGEDGMTPDAFARFTPSQQSLQSHTYEIGEQPGGLPEDWDRPFNRVFGGFRQAHNLGGVIDMYFNWWFKLTIRSLNNNACNYVLYRSPNLSWNLGAIATHTRIQIPLSMESCASLSAGNQVGAYSAAFIANDFGLHVVSTWDRYGGGHPCGEGASDLRNLHEGLYGLQFAIV